MPKAKTNKLLTARIGKQLVFPPNCYTRTWQLAQWCHGMVVMITVKLKVAREDFVVYTTMYKIKLDIYF